MTRLQSDQKALKLCPKSNPIQQAAAGRRQYSFPFAVLELPAWASVVRVPPVHIPRTLRCTRRVRAFPPLLPLVQQPCAKWKVLHVQVP